MSELPEVIEAVHVRTAQRYVPDRTKHANRGDGRMVFGLGVLLPGVGIPISDVASMSRIVDIAAAHDTTQATT